MIQNIEPKVFNNAFQPKQPTENARILVFLEEQILCNIENEGVHYPSYNEIKSSINENYQYIYLFSIDQTEYYLVRGENYDVDLTVAHYKYERVQKLRACLPKDLVFAGMTAYHLYMWYRSNVLCGRCGTGLEQDQKERMLFCPHCHNSIYPKICPCIIVAVTNQDRLLITKYANREYKKYALVAGFTEIGESLEDTVRREVMEEVGLKVKNIRFYKSQPWGFTNTLLCGFFAELDGADGIRLEEDELAEGRWVTRDELQVVYEDFSLTNEMMCRFKNGEM